MMNSFWNRIFSFQINPRVNKTSLQPVSRTVQEMVMKQGLCSRGDGEGYGGIVKNFNCIAVNTFLLCGFDCTHRCYCLVIFRIDGWMDGKANSRDC